jgi:Mitochondrial carrier protein
MNVGMMACYDQARTVMAHVYSDTEPTRPSLATKLSASCIAGFTAALFSLPFDMLKSRLQDQRPNSRGQASHSVFNCYNCNCSDCSCSRECSLRRTAAASTQCILW